MKRSRRHTSQILFWALSLLVVLSMALGLVISVMPQPRPPTPTLTPIPFSFAVCGQSIHSRLLRQVAEDGHFFLIHTGNLVSNGSEPNFQEFAALIADFPLPFYPVPGPRDYDQGTLDHFLRYSGAPGVHYSFDYGAVHFALANSDLGDMAAEELAWLRKDLTASDQPVNMVVLHYPPFDPDGSRDIMRSGHEEFMALMEEQGVDYVFAGHIQGYHAQERSGVHYIITGEGGPRHYVRVTVWGTEVTTEMVSLGE